MRQASVQGPTKATKDDAAQLSDLIFASGADNLTQLLQVPAPQKVQDYLLYALQHSQGQFGYDNQFVLRYDQSVIACISSWTNEMSAQFRQGTLDSLMYFFGIEHCADIFKRSAQLSQVIPAPASNELGVGHLAVLPDYQGHGYAYRLLEFVAQQALDLGKSFLSLDVGVDNVAARALYKKFGFFEHSQPDFAGAKSNLYQSVSFAKHVHLRYRI